MNAPHAPVRAAAAPIQVEACSKWYGQVIGIQDITLTVQRGVVGLLGPNGAGKTTLMKLLAGLLKPSRGRALLFGRAIHEDLEVRRRLGYAPEHEGVYDELSAREFVTFMAELSGVPRARARAQATAALVDIGLEAALDRRLHGFSKGMRQRTKLASALVHDPDVILLDEPLTGCDPVARANIIARIRALAAAGKTIVMSSHVLYEVEALTEEIVLVHRGRVLAEGNVHRIRELIDQHPHRVRVECDRPRELAARVLGDEHVVRVQFEDGAVEIETRAPDRLYDALPRLVLDAGLNVHSLGSPDDNMQAVFEYLTAPTDSKTASKSAGKPKAK
jgi:ABC-2 type transport system ATP-binding protein